MDAGDLAGAKQTAGDFGAAKEMAGALAEVKQTAKQTEHERMKAWIHSMIPYAGPAIKATTEAEDAAALIRIHLHDAYAQIAEAQAKAGDVSGAKQTAAQITDDSQRSEVYYKVALVQAVAGDLAGSEATAAQAGTWKAGAYRVIARVRARAANAAPARATSEKPKPSAAQIKNDRFVAGWVYRRAAEALFAAGDVAGAIELITEVNDDPRERCEWLMDLTKESAATKPASKGHG